MTVAPISPDQTRNPPIQPNNEWRKFFYHFGCSLKIDNRQMKGDCPFPDCQKEDHFYAAPGTGLWDCKRCGREGNAYDFLRELHATYYAETTPEHYEWLADQRPGLLAEVLEDWQLVFNSATQEWMIPSWSRQHQKIVNLHAWRKMWDDKESKEYMTLLAAPTMRQTIYGAHRLRTDAYRPLWINEGHWDTLGFDGLLRGLNLHADHDFCGMPGDSFLKDYLHLLEGRDVRLVSDSDKAGVMAHERLMKRLAEDGIMPQKFGVLVWPEGTPDGFDIRDLCACEDYSSWGSKYHFINACLKEQKIDVKTITNESYDPKVTPKPCQEFGFLADKFKEKLFMNEGMVDTLAVIYAINISLKMGGPTLWSYILGPPGSGKTTLVDGATAAHPYFYGLSQVSGIFSGWAGAGKNTDSGLVNKFQDRTVVYKDWTTILKLPPGVQDKLMCHLRDLSDGHAVAEYMNGKRFAYDNVRFSILACTTEAIRAYNHSTVGERFLQCDIDSCWDDYGYMSRYAKTPTDRAADNVLDDICDVDILPSGDLLEQKCLSWGFLESLHNELIRSNDRLVAITRRIKEDGHPFKVYCQNLAEWAAVSRTKVERDREKQLLYRPRTENANRLVKAFIKLGVSLCVVFRVPEPDINVFRIVRKIALDTGSGFHNDILLELAHQPYSIREALAQKINMQPTSCNNNLMDLKELGIVKATVTPPGMQPSKRQGHPNLHWHLSSEMEAVAKGLGFMVA